MCWKMQIHLGSSVGKYDPLPQSEISVNYIVEKVYGEFFRGHIFDAVSRERRGVRNSCLPQPAPSATRTCSV